jgi:hypothetical protein
MTETVSVFVYASEVHSNSAKIVRDAVKEVNKIYAQEGDISLSVVDGSMPFGTSSFANLNNLISSCSIAIFVIALDENILTAYSRSPNYIKNIEASWNIVQDLSSSGVIKRIAVFAASETVGRFVIPPGDERALAVRRLKEVLTKIKRHHLVYTYSSPTELASSIVGTFVRWQLDTLHLDSLPEVVPEQTRLGLIFGSHDREPLGLINSPNDLLLFTPDQSKIFGDIRERAELLLNGCGNSNELAILKSYSVKLISSMGRTVDEVNILSFWAPMNSLRRQSEADERIRHSADTYELPLPETIAGLLLDLVDNLNLFRAYQPKLADLDELAQDVVSRIINEKNLSAAGRVAKGAAIHRMAVTREAANSLQETIVEAVGSDPSAERAKQFSIRSARNLSLEAIRRVYEALKAEPNFAAKEMRAGVYKQLGQSFANNLGPFIIECQSDMHILFSTLGRNSTLQSVFDFVVQVLKSCLT